MLEYLPPGGSARPVSSEALGRCTCYDTTRTHHQPDRAGCHDRHESRLGDRRRLLLATQPLDPLGASRRYSLVDLRYLFRDYSEAGGDEMIATQWPDHALQRTCAAGEPLLMRSPNAAPTAEL